MARESALRYILLLSFFSITLAVYGSHYTSAGSISYATLDSIVNSVITNPAVVQDITSNAYVSNYLVNNPNSLEYFILYPVQVNSTLSNPGMLGADSNGIALVGFINNPSFVPVIQNTTNFDLLLTDSSLAGIMQNPLLLGCLLGNPSLASIVNNSSGLDNLVKSQGFSSVSSNTAAYCSFLGNPSLAYISSNSMQFSSFLSSSTSVGLINNPAAFTSLLSNPALPGIISSSGFQTFLGSGSSMTTLLSSPQFVAFMGNPAFITFLSGNSLGSVLSQSVALVSMINNPSFASITGNPVMLASLLSNPSLNIIIINQAGMASIISSPGFGSVVLNDPSAMSNLLANPALSSIATNPSLLTSFLGSSSFTAITSSPGALAALFSNPSLYSVLGNSAGFTTIIGNQTAVNMLANASVFTVFLSSPSLATILGNPSGFVSVISSGQMPSALSNPGVAISFLNNPSLGAVISNPALMSAFLSSPSLSQIAGNATYLGSLLTNPFLGSIISNPLQLGTLISSPGFGAVLGNSTAFAAILGNPSLLAISANPALLTSFLSNPAFSSIVSNPALLGSLMGNSGLASLLGNQAAFGSLLSNPALATIVGNPALLGSLLGNPSLNALLSQQSQLGSFLANPAFSIIISNPALLGSLLSNPSLSSLLGSTSMLTQLSSLLGSSSLLSSGFLSSSAFGSLLSNPSLTTILGNPQMLNSLTSLISSPSLSSILNSQSLGSLLGNPALTSLLTNPSFGSIVDNPALGSLLGNPGLSSLLGSSAVSSLLSNPGISSILSNPSLGSLLSSSSLSSLLGNSGLSSLLGNSQIGSLLSGGPNGLGGIPIPGLAGGGIPGLGGCAIGSPWFGFCTVVDTSAGVTNYVGAAGNGQITELPPVLNSNSPIPLIKNVLGQNIQNAQWLITCPVNPDPHNTLLYFTSKSNSFIAGNRCLANLVPLLTIVNLYTVVVWTPLTPALARNWYTITNMAKGWTSDIAYSGETIATASQAPLPSTGITTISTTAAQATCPNQDYQGSGTVLSFNQIVACAQNAGFSGTQLVQIVSIAYAESSGRPGATSPPGKCGSTAQGILQEGSTCAPNGEAYPLPGYDPSTCGTYTNNNWAGVYYNPECTFQWAYAFVSQSPAITSQSASGSGVTACTSTNTGEPYCFWGTYWQDGTGCNPNPIGNSCYCKFTPTSYSGYRCTGGLNAAFLPWNSIGVQSGGSGGGGGAGGVGVGSAANGYNISNGYDTQSYIFGQVPASRQNGVWSWSAKYANLANVNLAQLSYSQTLTGLQFMVPLLCQYTYNYKITSAITSLQNANVPVPQFDQSAYNQNQWLNFSGYLFSPIKQLGSSSCFGSLSTGFGCGGWTRIGNNGTLDLGGTKYSNLFVYYGTTGYSSSPSPAFPSSLIAVYPGGYAEVNAMAFNYINVNIVPYLVYNAGMPTAYTQINSNTVLYNMSYNLYSTHNLVQPANYLDEFSLYSDSAFFADYNGFLAEFPFNSVALYNPDPNSLDSPSNEFISQYSEHDARIVDFGQNNGKPIILGNTVAGRIPNPSYIAAAPNGYVYVVNYTSTSCWYCITTSTKADLLTFKFVPQGYFNMSYTPLSGEPGQSNYPSWVNQWKQYFNNAFYEGSQSLYLVEIYPLSYTKRYPFFTLDKGGILHNFLPLAAQPDDNGDLFLLGAHISGFGGTKGGFKLAGLEPPGSYNWIENDSVNKPAGFVPSDEFAASPGGQFVYVANASYPGEVEVYATNPTGQIQSSASGPFFTYAGNIPLSYSNSTYNLDISKYLSAGGPYNDSAVASAYKSFGSSPVYDSPYQHHPVSIIDSKGILYVIDNWTFTVGGAQSSILMLRAFSENGTEIPIDGQMASYFTPVLGAAGIVSQNPVAPSLGWAPYGWPLSANISMPNSGRTESYCAADCSFGPYDTNTPYPAIGPRIDGLGNVGNGFNSIYISADFNGTLYILGHPWKFSNAGSCTLGTGGSGCTGGSATSIYPINPLYTELLVLHPNIQNYTKISYLDNSTYACYLSIQAGSSPCIYTAASSQVLDNIYPPILGVPSSFGYAEGLGGPEQYLGAQNLFSSLFPSGINTNQYKSKQQSELKNGLSGQPNYNSLITNPSASNPAVTTKLPSSYLRSSVSGYVVTPYNIVVTLKQSWTDTSQTQLNPFIPCLPLSAIIKLSGLSGGSTTDTFSYKTTGLTNEGPLNMTIEGGSTYLQYLPLQTNYIQNLSDAGTIIPPYLSFQMLSNRQFGELFVNETINPQTASLPARSRVTLPVVVNAIRTYDYQKNTFQQISAFGISPAYVIQQSIPINQVVGANCGGSCATLAGLVSGSKYYYGNNYYKGNSIFNYSNENITKFMGLFELFKQASHVGSLILNLSTENNLLGYNRLIYTFVDRFNNTIYAPLDVDFANMTVMSLTSSSAVNAVNANKTAVSLHGFANYTTYTGVHPVPKGSSVYLYWNGNINYYNTTSTPTVNPINYYTWALRCAISPSSNSCQLASPVNTKYQKQPVGTQEADHVNYKTNAGGSCPSQPKSLLQPIVYNCNLYNNYKLSAVRTDPNNPSAFQYCVPIYPNGTGQFTAQMGLIGIATTNSLGYYSFNTIACGVGQNRVIAVYYGNAAPEPIPVRQTWLGASGQTGEFAALINPSDIITSPEYNYNDAPNSSTTSFETGSYALSFGAINIIGIATLLAIVSLIVYTGANRRKK